MKLALVILLVVIVEFFLEAIFAGQWRKREGVVAKLVKQHHFSLWRYFIFFGLPFATLLFFIAAFSYEVWKVVIIFSLLGTFMEWLVGFSYHQVMGNKLWTYHRYSIGEYTSF